jgi:hypothetical protein
MVVLIAFDLLEATASRSLITRADEHSMGSLPAGLQNGLMVGHFRKTSYGRNTETIRNSTRLLWLLCN